MSMSGPRLVAILLEIAEDKNARKADRIAAAKELLDRGWGKTPFVAAQGEALEEDEIIREAVGIVDEIARRRKGNGDGASS